MGKITNIYYQIKDDINNKLIVERLPSELKLCEKYNCSRSTIRLVISKLQSSGIIDSKQGKGHFISKNIKNNTIKSFIDKQKNKQHFDNIIENVKVFDNCISEYNLKKIIMYKKKRLLNEDLIEESNVILNKWLLKDFDIDKAKKSIISFLEVDQKIKLAYEKNYMKCVSIPKNSKIITKANFLIFSRSIYFNEYDEIVCIIEYFLAPEFLNLENIYYGK